MNGLGTVTINARRRASVAREAGAVAAECQISSIVGEWVRLELWLVRQGVKFVGVRELAPSNFTCMYLLTWSIKIQCSH